MVKKSACNAGNSGSIPGSGKSLGEGNGNPLQYSCLENSMDRRAWWATVHGVTRSQTRLGELTLGTVLLWVFSVTISSPLLFSMNLVQRLVNLWGHPCLSLNKYFTFRIGYLQLGSSGKCNTWNYIHHPSSGQTHETLVSGWVSEDSMNLFLPERRIKATHLSVWHEIHWKSTTSMGQLGIHYMFANCVKWCVFSVLCLNALSLE